MLDTTFGSFRLTWERRNGTLVVSRRLRLDKNRVPVDQYAAFREFAIRVDQASRQVVVVEKKGGDE